MTPKVLVVGGYGQVGRGAAEQLAPNHPGRIVLGGRDLANARQTARLVGHGSTGRQFDATAKDSELDGIGLVLMCVEQDDESLARRCLADGIDYVDISASHAFLKRVEELNDVAVANQATAVLSVGVSPGLTNLLAAHALEQMHHVDSLDILLELGMGDQHGTAAIEWMFDNFGTPFEVEGEGRQTRGFDEAARLALPGEPDRKAYRFDFSDQHVLPRTLGVPRVSTWLRFSSRTATSIVAASVQLGVARLLRFRWFRRAARWLVQHGVGSTRCAVAVRAQGLTRDDTSERLTFGLHGHHEALMTSVVAAHTVHQLLTQGLRPGVFHIEQVFTLESFIPALQRVVPGLSVSLGGS